MLNLLEVWSQADSDSDAVPINSQSDSSRVYLGVKITLSQGLVIILNTHLGGDYYQEVEPHEYMEFLLYGWKVGAIDVAMRNAERSLSVAVRDKSPPDIVAHYSSKIKALAERKSNLINQIKCKKSQSTHSRSSQTSKSRALRRQKVSLPTFPGWPPTGC